jgi:hypothetical protein
MAQKSKPLVINYQFFETHQLLIQQGIGDWSEDHHDKYVDKVFKSDKMKAVKMVLSDMRFAKMEGAVNNVSSITRQRYKVAELDYINVFLVSDPMNTVTTHLYTTELISKGFKYNYCSTIELAIKLLGVDLSVMVVEQFLENLENQF